MEVELTEPDGWPSDKEAAEFEKLLPCPLPVGTSSKKWVGQSIRKIDGVWFVILTYDSTAD